MGMVRHERRWRADAAAHLALCSALLCPSSPLALHLAPIYPPARGSSSSGAGLVVSGSDATPLTLSFSSRHSTVRLDLDEAQVPAVEMRCRAVTMELSCTVQNCKFVAHG